MIPEGTYSQSVILCTFETDFCSGDRANIVRPKSLNSLLEALVGKKPTVFQADPSSLYHELELSQEATLLQSTLNSRFKPSESNRAPCKKHCRYMIKIRKAFLKQ